MTIPRKPVEVGLPLDLTEAELDQAAEVTPVDVASAKGLWVHAAPKALRDLLNAEQTDG